MENRSQWEDLPLLLTPAQAGKVLHLNPNMIRTMCQAKAIPCVRPTSKYLIPRDALRAWIEKKSQTVEDWSPDRSEINMDTNVALITLKPHNG